MYLIYLTNFITFIIAKTTVNQADKNLPTDAETIVQGAINGSEIFVSAFDNDWKLFASGQNPVYIAIVTALSAAIRYILKAESNDRRGARRKLYCITAGSAVMSRCWRR